MKKISKKEIRTKLFINSMEIYNLMYEITSMIGPKTITTCKEINEEVKGLIKYIKQNIYLLKNGTQKKRFKNLMKMAEDFYYDIVNYNPFSEVEDDMFKRLWFFTECRYYGLELIDMYNHDVFPYELFENFDFKQYGRTIIDLDANRLELE